MTELKTQADTIQLILAGFRASISELETSEFSHLPVDGSAFGSSAAGARAQRSTAQAHAAVLDTLAALRAAHDDFSESLRVVNTLINDTDETIAAEFRAAAQA